jgi:hypothetical protein
MSCLTTALQQCCCQVIFLVLDWCSLPISVDCGAARLLIYCCPTVPSSGRFRCSATRALVPLCVALTYWDCQIEDVVGVSKRWWWCCENIKAQGHRKYERYHSFSLITVKIRFSNSGGRATQTDGDDNFIKIQRRGRSYFHFVLLSRMRSFVQNAREAYFDNGRLRI